MKYWFLVGAALTGGFLLLNGALADLIPFYSRVQVLFAILFIGVGRRMMQERFHAPKGK